MWAYIQRDWNQNLKETPVHSQVHCSIIHNGQDMEATWISMKNKTKQQRKSTYIIYGILFSLKKEKNSAICDKTDEPGGPYAMWNKPYIG